MTDFKRGERGPTGDRGPLGPDGPRGYEGDDGLAGPEGPMGTVDLPPAFWRNLAVSCGIVAFIVAGVMSMLTSRMVGEDSRRGIYDAQVKGCERAITDRIAHRDESFAAWKANLAVSMDKQMTSIVRRARRKQAAENEQAIRSYETRIPKADRITEFGRLQPDFVCADLYPKP